MSRCRYKTKNGVRLISPVKAAASKSKDAWDKADIVFKAVGAVLSATATLAVVALGYLFTSRLEGQKSMDARVRIYSELMTKREEVSTTLRKEVFQFLVPTFLKSEPQGDLETRILKLELFAQNFHEFINLGPLFKHLERCITTIDPETQGHLMERLYAVATEVTKKQRVIVEGSGTKFDRTVKFELLKKANGGIELKEADIVLNGIARNMKVYIHQADLMSGEMLGRIAVSPQNENILFTCGPFQFPMVNSFALSHGQHCAVILNNLIPHVSAEISVVCFPKSYSSLKEQAYYEEVARNVLSELNGPKKSQLK
jgi:hypothetical protein